MRKGLLSSLLLLLLFSSCKYIKRKKVIIRDTTITRKTSFNNIFFDSAHLDAFVEQNKQYEPFIQQFRDFYSHRNYEFAWFDTSGLAEQAHNFMNLQNSYIGEVADSSLFNHSLQALVDSLGTQKTKPSLTDPKVLQTELLLTGQFFQYAAKVYKGSDIDAEQLGWFIPRKKINLTALLDSSLKSKAKETDQYAPQNSQYKKIQEYLSKYLLLEKQEASDTILAVTKSLKKGDSALRITQVKKRLQLLGDMEPGDSSDRYDSVLLMATKKFQKRMGLSIDGAIGNRMIAELNVPISKRIRQLLVNMERVRWMPAEKDTNYILVNIPEYKMHVYDSGHLVYDMNVIVGATATSTVIFNGNLKYIVFSPYWNVPESIVTKEIMPAIKKDPNYITKSNMEITGYSGKTPIVGLVKFLFPNNYNIYFHDTPNHDLFALSNRSFSHGCIRLGEPKKFAEYMLRFDTSWNSKNIDSSMHLTKEKWVTIKKAVPVFIVYFTAWVDKDGLINFRKDIYGHDEKMSEKLFMN